MADEKQTYITEEGFNRLQQELDHLKNTKRLEVADRIATAKELGDLSENAEYSDAKDEQSFVERRIAELENIVRSVNIIKKGKKSSSVQVGSTIEIEDEKGVLKKYSIVGSNEADPAQGKISNESPLGQAFIGKKSGENVSVNTPKGKMNFKIIKIS
jgi:transcription elongation factor GreA